MHYLFFALVIAAIVYGPSLWVKYILNKFASTRPDLQGTGGELAEHLIKRFELTDVQVEVTTQGDHYNPLTKTVGLSEGNFNGKSLTAVATAAHEIGHAIQDNHGYQPLKMRQSLAVTAFVAEKVGSIGLVVLPLLAIVMRAPGLVYASFFLAMASVAVKLIVHLVTLPVEFDASFNRALPILKAGEYLQGNDLAAAHVILKACAYTYVAGALANILNLAYWVRVLLRR
ncbi:MAG: zinc metallopeptidase [Methylococcales bacterium]|jgi:uncharacterized protein|nr:zinc metallopeptidase [Methylococcales bacterium]MBT7442887.1 zinc metallopeptidase [Methylococcales bacterium]